MGLRTQTTGFRKRSNLPVRTVVVRATGAKTSNRRVKVARRRAELLPPRRTSALPRQLSTSEHRWRAPAELTRTGAPIEAAASADNPRAQRWWHQLQIIFAPRRKACTQRQCVCTAANFIPAVTRPTVQPSRALPKRASRVRQAAAGPGSPNRSSYRAHHDLRRRSLLRRNRASSTKSEGMIGRRERAESLRHYQRRCSPSPTRSDRARRAGHEYRPTTLNGAENRRIFRGWRHSSPRNERPR